MAMLFANALSALAKVANNGFSTFTYFGFFAESDCPEEML